MNRVGTLCVLIVCIFIIFFMSYFQIQSYRGIDKKTECIGSSSFSYYFPRVYPKRHWKYKVSKSCMHCLHRTLITLHWGEDGLFCENCKTVHKSRMSKHYLYDEALVCMRCGHEKIMRESHQESKLGCEHCKMGHYDHYNMENWEKVKD